MGILVLLILFVVIAFAIVAAVTWREYQRTYAEVHHDVPPLVDWVYRRDPDPDVEGARRTANFAMWGSIASFVVLGAAAYLSGPG